MSKDREYNFDFDKLWASGTVDEAKQTLREILSQTFAEARSARGTARTLASATKAARSKLREAKRRRDDEMVSFSEFGISAEKERILDQIFSAISLHKEAVASHAKQTRSAQIKVVMETLKAAALVPGIVTGRAAEVIGGAMVDCATSIGTAVQSCADHIIGYGDKLTRPAYIKQEMGKFFATVSKAIDKAVDTMKELPSNAVGLLTTGLKNLASICRSTAKKIDPNSQVTLAGPRSRIFPDRLVNLDHELNKAIRTTIPGLSGASTAGVVPRGSQVSPSGGRGTSTKPEQGARR